MALHFSTAMDYPAYPNASPEEIARVLKERFFKEEVQILVERVDTDPIPIGWDRNPRYVPGETRVEGRAWVPEPSTR